MPLSPEEKHTRRIDRIENTLKQFQLGKAKNKVAADFQKLVKLRAADGNGIIKCVTCGFTGKWNATKGLNGAIFDAGHFYSRRHAATLYVPMNCHPQCVGCNRYKDGNLTEYCNYMEATYKPEQLEWLHEEHTKLKQWGRRELAELKAVFMDQVRAELKRLEVAS